MHEEINTMGKKVGRVLDIDGFRVVCARRFKNGEVGTYQAHKGMILFLNDHLKTDNQTAAYIEFDIGGRAGVSPGTEIVITGAREIAVVGNPVVVKSGKIWAKIDKQKSQLQIQTAGGVIGIEG